MGNISELPKIKKKNNLLTNSVFYFLIICEEAVRHLMTFYEVETLNVKKMCTSLIEKAGTSTFSSFLQKLVQYLVILNRY